MYERTAKQVINLRKAEPISFLSAMVRDKLDAFLKRNARYCINTQQKNGAWMVVPDPRVLETALISDALRGSSKKECTSTSAKRWPRIDVVAAALMLESRSHSLLWFMVNRIKQAPIARGLPRNAKLRGKGRKDARMISGASMNCTTNSKEAIDKSSVVPIVYHFANLPLSATSSFDKEVAL